MATAPTNVPNAMNKKEKECEHIWIFLEKIIWEAAPDEYIFFCQKCLCLTEKTDFIVIDLEE